MSDFYLGKLCLLLLRRRVYVNIFYVFFSCRYSCAIKIVQSCLHALDVFKVSMVLINVSMVCDYRYVLPWKITSATFE